MQELSSVSPHSRARSLTSWLLGRVLNFVAGIFYFVANFIAASSIFSHARSAGPFSHAVIPATVKPNTRAIAIAELSRQWLISYFSEATIWDLLCVLRGIRIFHFAIRALCASASPFGVATPISKPLPRRCRPFAASGEGRRKSYPSGRRMFAIRTTALGRRVVTINGRLLAAGSRLTLGACSGRARSGVLLC